MDVIGKPALADGNKAARLHLDAREGPHAGSGEVPARRSNDATGYGTAVDVDVSTRLHGSSRKQGVVVETARYGRSDGNH